VSNQRPLAVFSVGVGLLYGRQNCTAVGTLRQNSQKIGAGPASRLGARAFLQILYERLGTNLFAYSQ